MSLLAHELSQTCLTCYHNASSPILKQEPAQGRGAGKPLLIPKLPKPCPTAQTMNRRCTPETLVRTPWPVTSPQTVNHSRTLCYRRRGQGLCAPPKGPTKKNMLCVFSQGRKCSSFTQRVHGYSISIRVLQMDCDGTPKPCPRTFQWLLRGLEGNGEIIPTDLHSKTLIPIQP